MPYNNIRSFCLPCYAENYVVAVVFSKVRGISNYNFRELDLI